MSTIETTLLHRPEPTVTDLPVWRFTVDEYRRMSENGTLTDDDAVELLEGLLVPKMPKNPPHILVCKLLRRYLEQLLGGEWHVSTQDPVATDDSEPEPDLAVIRGKEEDYSDRIPWCVDCPLLIEVADTTLNRDRGIKCRIYARAGFTQYWVVSIPDRTIEVFTEPTGATESPRYAQTHRYGMSDVVPVELEGRHLGEVAVADVFPMKDGP